MRFDATTLEGAHLISLQPVHDERGYFARSFCVQEFAAHGLVTRYVQHSVSLSTRKGTLRGMHYQRPPHGEVKLVRCLNGAIWDVIIDIRPSSPTFCQWQGFELSDRNGCQLYIPEGFAHGFQTLCDDVQVGYLISEFYVPEASSGIRHDDPAFEIPWPLPVTVISEKDLAWPNFVNKGDRWRDVEG